MVVEPTHTAPENGPHGRKDGGIHSGDSNGVSGDSNGVSGSRSPASSSLVRVGRQTEERVTLAPVEQSISVPVVTQNQEEVVELRAKAFDEILYKELMQEKRFNKCGVQLCMCDLSDESKCLGNILVRQPGLGCLWCLCGILRLTVRKVLFFW